MFSIFNPDGRISKVRVEHLRLIERINKAQASFANSKFVISNGSGTALANLSGGLNIIEYNGTPPRILKC